MPRYPEQREHLIDPELVAHVQDRLAAERRRELAQLEQPVRLVPKSEDCG